jgi:Na+-translocating ferredoxin:NAD+ oxidoreductase RnfG subunit
MRHYSGITLLIFFLSFLLAGFGLPGNIQKKVFKEVSKTFEIEDFNLVAITVPYALNQELPLKIQHDKLFKIEDNSVLLGYVFIDKAPSKTAEFDYLVLFNPDLEIVHSKVLIYREEYGGEIGSRRWLRQFLGKNGNDRVSHETNIDGIAGATISVRSMTNSMDNLLQTIGILQENMVL